MRRRARDAAFKFIYEEFFNEVMVDDFISSFSEIPDSKTLNESDSEYLKLVSKHYSEHKEDIMKIIEEKLIGYDSSRTYKIDLALIILAIIEIKYMEVPCPVAITEVVDLAKIYSTEKSPSFIHGFLASVFKGE